MVKLPATYLIAGGVVLAALVWAATKGAKGAGAAIVSGAVDMVDGAVSESVFTVGEAVGIPRTNMTECERAKAEGRTWDASFACPAADFLRYVWS